MSHTPNTPPALYAKESAPVGLPSMAQVDEELTAAVVASRTPENVVHADLGRNKRLDPHVAGALAMMVALDRRD